MILCFTPTPDYLLSKRRTIDLPIGYSSKSGRIGCLDH
jgi:hypothetical protein